MKRILIQLDTDPQPSSFDRVVAIDADVDELFSYGNVTPETVEPLVHGAMFTRGPNDLKNTAIFIGGSNVAASEAVMKKVLATFFGPMRVSVMMDANGSNTTAAAAVIAASRHLPLANTETLLLGGTGPVGLRIAQLLAKEEAVVRIASRSLERARQTCETIAAAVPGSRLIACEIETADGLQSASRNVQLIIAAGAAGVELFSEEARLAIPTLKVAIDLNAVPPAGLQGIDVTDKADDKNNVICYGAIGIGGTKMTIHKTAIKTLFTQNNALLETETIYEIAQSLSNK